MKNFGVVSIGVLGYIQAVLETAHKKLEVVPHQNCSPLNIRCGFSFLDKFNAPNFHDILIVIVISFRDLVVTSIKFSDSMIFKYFEFIEYFDDVK